MKGLYIKSTDILITISIIDSVAPPYKVTLAIVNFSTMKVDYFNIGPDMANIDLNKVIFLSDTRYYMQISAKSLYLNNTDPL